MGKSKFVSLVSAAEEKRGPMNVSHFPRKDPNTTVCTSETTGIEASQFMKLNRSRYHKTYVNQLSHFSFYLSHFQCTWKINKVVPETSSLVLLIVILKWHVFFSSGIMHIYWEKTGLLVTQTELLAIVNVRISTKFRHRKNNSCPLCQFLDIKVCRT